MKTSETKHGNFTISTSRTKLDIAMIHQFLCYESTWCMGISYNLVETSINNSLNFGLYDKNQQIGYARVITDYTTIAYLGDVFIITNYQKQGLSKFLMQVITNHPNLQGLRRWILLTSTADWLYRKYGFENLTNPEIYMEKYNPNIYE